MSKTTTFLKILYQVSLSPSRCLPESRLKELMDHPSKSTWHRQINELLIDTKDAPALLIQTENPEGERLYCLNSEGWQAFLNANEEGKFLLECYRQIGYLLESDFTNMVFDLTDMDRAHVGRLERKFLHLAKVRARENKLLRESLDAIIEGLVSEKELEITYDGGLRIVRPLTLCQYRDELYLMCTRLENGEWEKRTYKIARMSNVKIRNQKFSYPSKKDWNPMEEYKEASGLVLGKVKQVQIRVYGSSRKIISEKEFFNCQLINRDTNFDSYLCTYTNSAEFLGQVFVYAQDIEIMDDGDLISEFIHKAEEALRKNKKAA